MAIQCHSQNAAMKIGMWSVAVIVNTHYQFIVHDKGASLNSIVLLDKMDILGFSMYQTIKKNAFCVLSDWPLTLRKSACISA